MIPPLLSWEIESYYLYPQCTCFCMFEKEHFVVGGNIQMCAFVLLLLLRHLSYLISVICKMGITLWHLHTITELGLCLVHCI